MLAKVLSIFLIFQTFICNSQDLVLQKLTKKEIQNKVLYHYHYDFGNSDTDIHVTIDLTLLKNRTFDYWIAGCMNEQYSTGSWIKSGNYITLNSDLQKNTLPITISYRPRDSSDFDTKKIAFLKDINGNPVTYAFIYINNDSTSCMDGDMMCIGEYQSIDSVKVWFENYGISSKWFRIKPFKGMLQVTINTKRDLSHYLVLNNHKYFIKNKWLSLINE